jgi:hypothetical protein
MLNVWALSPDKVRTRFSGAALQLSGRGDVCAESLQLVSYLLKREAFANWLTKSKYFY